MIKLFLLIASMSLSSFIFCQENSLDTIKGKWYLETALSYTHFEQQVKKEIGGLKGELLVDETTFSFSGAAGYKVFPFLSLGAYVRYDDGRRVNARFNGFNLDGETTVTASIGGDFSEIWIGPYLRGHYKNLFLSVGYGLFGSRSDDGRSEVVTTLGDNSEDFSLDPSVAWIFNIGGVVPITKALSMYFGIEYRARYYNQREGENLIGNIVLGTQNITPLIGANYSF